MLLEDEGIVTMADTKASIGEIKQLHAMSESVPFSGKTIKPAYSSQEVDISRVDNYDYTVTS